MPDGGHRDEALSVAEVHALVVRDLDALVVLDAVERVAGRTVREVLDFGTRAFAVVNGEVGAVHVDNDRDAVFVHDLETFAVVEVDGFVVRDGAAVLAFEPEEGAMLVVPEGLEFRPRSGLVVDVVGMAVDFDLDRRAHLDLSLRSRPSRSCAFIERSAQKVET